MPTHPKELRLKDGLVKLNGYYSVEELITAMRVLVIDRNPHAQDDALALVAEQIRRQIMESCQCKPQP